MSWFTTTTGARIGQILDGMDFNDRANFWQGGIKADGTRNTGALDTGDSITVGNADGSKSALQLIADLLEAERGVFYISKDGKATYEERESRDRRTSSTATLTTYALTSQPGFEFDQLVNRQAVVRQSQSGAAGTSPNTLVTQTPQVAKNDISVKTFGVQDGSELQSEYLATDAQALALAQFIVNLRSSFVAPVTIEMDGGPSAATTQMLSLELQDRVTVSDATAGTSGDYIIEGIEVEIADGGNRFVTTFTLSEYGTLPFVFGSSTQGTFAPPDTSAGTAYTVTNKALTSNVATLTIGAHSFIAGQSVTVASVDSTFNGNYAVTAVTSTTISYAKSATNVASTAATGTATLQAYTVCNSSARPSSPNNGDYILESDTGRFYRRVAGAWVQQTYPRLTY